MEIRSPRRVPGGMSGKRSAVGRESAGRQPGGYLSSRKKISLYKVCHSVTLCLIEFEFGAVCQLFERGLGQRKKFFLSVKLFFEKVGIRIATGFAECVKQNKKTDLTGGF